ncbi:hypothetical protein Nepgr_022234 [Nepenthes gracilis]|uniref:Uncharacterized protein n=1 Tax=Nepenthes gracilis TaxID=150966 RepID=A0AAD3SZZ2_NEPGR|nr:hypothetical protein Nepgr_022234 [Nepenthes gracilis]
MVFLGWPVLLVDRIQVMLGSSGLADEAFNYSLLIQLQQVLGSGGCFELLCCSVLPANYSSAVRMGHGSRCSWVLKLTGVGLQLAAGNISSPAEASGFDDGSAVKIGLLKQVFSGRSRWSLAVLFFLVEGRLLQPFEADFVILKWMGLCSLAIFFPLCWWFVEFVALLQWLNAEILRCCSRPGCAALSCCCSVPTAAISRLVWPLR